MSHPNNINEQLAAHAALQQGPITEETPPVLTGASGMAIINEMFQRQARRLESQQQLHVQDRKAVEYTQAQLLVMQAQLQWHASRYQERAEQVTKSTETISRMQTYLGSMEAERERAVETATLLARDVNSLRQHMEASQPEKLQTLSTTLSDMAMRVCARPTNIPRANARDAWNDSPPRLPPHATASAPASGPRPTHP